MLACHVNVTCYQTITDLTRFVLSDFESRCLLLAEDRCLQFFWVSVGF